MNKFEMQFNEYLKTTVPHLKDVICYKFKQGEEGEYVSEEDNGLMILHTDKKFSYIRIKHNISSNQPNVRFKMYYAQQPNDAFSEECSKILGFFDGEDYEDILEFKGDKVNSFRFDFGYDPICFKINSFILEELPQKEVLKLKCKKITKYATCIFRYILKLNKVFIYIGENGLRAGVERARYVLNNEDGNKKFNLSTQQVVEPYEVQLKHPLEKERKKVLHFLENFYTGGSSRLVIDILEYYGHKYNHKIFTMAYRGKEEFLGVDVEVIDVENKTDILRKIEEYSPDIIHVHIWKGEWYHKVFNILDQIPNRVVIENINTPIEPITREYIKKYIFVSQYVLNTFYDVGDIRSTVIYPGSNFSMFTRKLEEGYLAKDTIGMVYRLGYDKLNSKSIDVFIKTVQKRPKTKAIIVGGGPRYDSYVEKVKKAGVFKSFIFTGYVPYVDLPSWYERFTIFVAPVWQESFGQVSPFAMSMGIPVAGYNIGALNEIINNESLLAAPDDSEKLSNILVELLDDYEKCVEIGKYNQQRAQSLFGVQKMVDDYFALYEEVTKADGVNQ